MLLWKGLAGLPRSVWMLSLSTLVNRLGTIVMFFLTLYLVQGLGWSESQAATAMAMYGLGALVASPISGRLSDRFGHRRTLILSLTSSALLLLTLPYSHSRPLLLGLIALWSAVTQAFWPASMALITDLVEPDQRKQAFVLHRLASNLGLALGPALGGFLAQWSYRSLFWVDALTTLAGVAVLILGVPTLPQTEIHTTEPSPTGWKDRHLLGLLLALLPATLVFTQIHGTLPLWVSRDLSHGPAFFGLLFTFNTALILLFEVALNTHLARWPHGPQLALGALLFALGFGLTGLARPVWLLATTVAAWTFGEMIFLPASSDAVAALAPPDRRGEYMGLYSMSWTIALSLGPWLGLKAYAHVTPLWLWAGCGCVALLSAISLVRFRAHRFPTEGQ